MEVVAQEAEQPTGQAGHEEGHERAAVVQAHPEDGPRGCERDAGGEAVEAIDEVEGVRHPDDPEDGEREAEDAQAEGAKGGGDGVGPVFGEPHEGRNQDLDGELDARAGALQVVEGAERRDGEAAQDEGERPLRLAPEEAPHPGVEEEEGDERGEEGGHDGHAAEAGDGLAVDLAGGEGVVEHAEADGRTTNQGGETSATVSEMRKATTTVCKRLSLPPPGVQVQEGEYGTGLSGGQIPCAGVTR